MSHAVAWETFLPERSQTLAYGRKPLASLVLWAEGKDAEEISVPVAVARSLDHRRKRGELNDVTRKELLDTISELQRECAKDCMLGLLERRDMSTGEVTDRLTRKGYPRFAREHAIEVGKRCALLDDEHFAERFAHSKSLTGWGIHRIEAELRNRGIDVSNYAGWPEDFLDVDGEYDRALAVASRKHVREPNARAKMARFLVGGAFSTGIAIRAAEEALAPATEE